MIKKILYFKFSAVMLSIPYVVLADAGRDQLDLPVDLSVQGDCSVGKDLTVQGMIKLIKFKKDSIPACDKDHEGVLIYAEEKADGSEEAYLFLCTHDKNGPRWVNLEDSGAVPYGK